MSVAPVAVERFDPSSRNVPVMSRAQFLADWDYQRGQHLTMLGPTQRGKTTFGLQLLDKSISPEMPVVIFAGKPPHRDKTMNDAATQLNLRIVETYPPDYHFGDKKRRGFVLRPKQTMVDVEADNENIGREFKHGLQRNYASKKPVISFVDEAHHVQNELKLKKEYEAPLLRGAPDNAMWSLLQRGRFSSYLTYNMADHLFIFYDPDADNRKRYADIGGVDPRFLVDLSETLKTYKVNDGRTTISECIYIRRAGPQICVVDVV